MRGTYITALIIGLVLCVWLYSGWISTDNEIQHATLAELNREQADVAADRVPTRVRVAVLEASEQWRSVRVRGKTANKRSVEVRAELSGRLVSRPVERGDRVQTGDVLCKISLEDREVALVEANAALNQARIDYQGALRLKEKGFNSQSAIAAARARLAKAQADLSRRELALEKIHVRAPFAGTVENVQLEVGDYVTPGGACATIIDPDPMLLVGRVSEREVVDVSIGQIARGKLSNDIVVSGPVTFIGQQSDQATRTYPIEIQVPNADMALRSGLTADINIPVESLLAQKVSPALFSLDDTGDIGIRTINADNVVEFYYVNVLRDAADGVWVTGLPNRAAVITVGQELVITGERVDPVFQGNATQPAQTPAPAPTSDLEDPSAAIIAAATEIGS